ATLGPGEGGKGAVILQLIRGKPAFNAGIQVGDNIVEVNGEDVTAQTSGQIRNKIVGPLGTKVTVGVKRAGSDVTLRFEMIRQKIEVTTVTKALLPGNIGYVSLETFQTDKGNDQLTAAIKDL
ncbi:PDZ domain-containing protein, partial [Escherichia coli]|nr:PDZ domain-containing protein [Escherichia coli]